LSAIHSILSDEHKRKLYDESGTLDDQDNSGDFDSWSAYFRNMFPVMTTSDIDKYLANYRGSQEEKNDILGFYERFDGDLEMMMNYIIGSDDENAIDRICCIIDEATQSNFIKSTSKYASSKTKLLSKRTKLSKRQKISVESNSTSNLEQLIRNNQHKRKARTNQMLEKWGITEDDVEQEDIPDEEFNKVQKSITKEKRKKI